MLVDTFERWGALAALCSQFPAVKHVWVRTANSSAVLSACSGAPAVTLLTDALPAAAPAPHEQDLDPHATATLIYTSGTTGLPKGVMLTHFAILWNCEAATKFIAPFRSDVFLSFLPLAHAFERTLGYYLPMMGGATVTYARSVETLREDLLAIRPTVLLAVPRIYERVYETIRSETQQHPIKGVLVRRAAEVGWQLREAKRRRAPCARSAVAPRLAPARQDCCAPRARRLRRQVARRRQWRSIAARRHCPLSDGAGLAAGGGLRFDRGRACRYGDDVGRQRARLGWSAPPWLGHQAWRTQ